MPTHLDLKSARENTQQGLQKRPMSWRERIRNWRSQKIADPRFRNRIERFWFTRPVANNQANELFKITAGFVYSQTLYACVELGVFKALENGGRTTTQVHRLLGARTANITEKRLQRLLEAAESLKLITEVDEGIWALDDFGAVIASDPGIRAMITHHSMLYRDLTDPVALIAGETPETEIGRYWAYASSREPGKLPPEQVNAYSTLMEQSQAMIAEAIIAGYEIGKHKHVLDIGGGDGAFLGHVHTRHPNLTLSLFDLPSVAVRAPDYFDKLHPNARLNIQSGDFFRDSFNADADLYTLIRICCDHDDDAVLELLANVHRSMKPGARLLIGEAIGGVGTGERLASAYFKLYFAAMGSGECRTPDQLQRLLAKAGFSSSNYRKTSNPLIASIVIANR